METSSSKVTVEYHDPSGVFPLVSRDIAARLPLRNLNWQTSSRPLRQIRQLHVEFIPDKETDTSLRPPTQRFDSNGATTSFDIVRSGRDQRKDGPKERRHQIPGLKTSPYLKLYVLRCDDKDAYKQTERNRIKEWLREEVRAEKQTEHHSAFEWLILHVVIPDTVAASEPRWRESQSEPDTLKERKTSNVKFPGKSSRTVFDRLRQDFNESGKTASDHIAQVRLLKSELPADLLPTPAAAATLAETPQERENAWKDLMDKLKTSILGPFDARVRQYEADIAEQETRRSLPGWNFCTFFIHKEGLAKALESIGLVEDALAIYDELSLGLETVIREIAAGRAEGTATTFAQHTDDIETRILSDREQANGISNGDDHKSVTAHAVLFEKDYREQIVRSTISVFDFFCYLFMRQKALILRLANTQVARLELGDVSGSAGEDLVLTSEVCWRASAFIHNNARTLRQDLSNAPSKKSSEDIEALVSSWTYAMADLVLSETAAPVLELAANGEQGQLNNAAAAPKRADFEFAMGANPYPTRSSSLMTARKSAPELKRPPSVPSSELMSPPSSSGTDTAPKGAGVPGLPELATYRAELVMLQRKMLEHIAAQSGWRAGWSAMRHRAPSKMQDITLDEDDGHDTTENQQETTSDYVASSLILPALKPALASESAFQEIYERICDRAMRYYALATQSKSVEVIVGDLAMLRYQQGNIEITEEYIRNVLPGYAADGWNSTEAEVLSIYAECLKRLQRTEAYITTVLDLLAKVCVRRMTRKLPHWRFEDAHLDTEAVDVSGLMPEICAMSTRLSHQIVRPMSDYFGGIVLDSEVRHHNDCDGFKLELRFNSLLADELDFDECKARLVSVNDSAQEVWLSSSGPFCASPGTVKVDLQSYANTFGPFYVDQISMKSGNLVFSHEMQPRSSNPTLVLNDEKPPLIESQLHNRPFVFVYPPERALDVDVSTAKNVQLDKPRGLVFRIYSGWNEIEDLELKLRPTSAGLRLHLADVEGGKARNGQLVFGSLGQHANATIEVPYTVEQATPDISLRFEAQYHTPKGTFTLSQAVTLRHRLPFDVEVDDMFRLDTLFSTFAVCSTGGAPIMLLDATLHDSSVYEVESPPSVGLPMMVFDQAPANLLYKIRRKESTASQAMRKDAPLALIMRYIASHNLIIAALKEDFTQHLHDRELGSLSRLLVPLLIERCKQLPKSMFEIAAILGQVSVPSYEDFGWAEIESLLPDAVQSELSDALQTWHQQASHFKVDFIGAISDEIQGQITIPVEVPTIDFVHSVGLALHEREHDQPHKIQTLRAGKPLQASVSIRSNDRWSYRSVFGSSKSSDAHSPEFTMEIQADPDTWLVGGQRRLHFRPSKEQASKFEITLIPIRPGIHTFPSVDIRPAPEVKGEGHNAQTAQSSFSCETYCEAAGKKVQGIRDVRTVKVHIQESFGPASHARPSAGSRAMTESG
ncbi:hypothetical protein KC330_g3153 [Hortaea werneckii]|nr:hypothetical protein KC330_g3153 [Hortaea werneckii]